MQEFIEYLLKGLAVITEVFSGMTFYIYSTSFSLLDLVTYSAIISFVLPVIDKVSKSVMLSKNRLKTHKVKGA